MVNTAPRTPAQRKPHRSTDWKADRNEMDFAEAYLANDFNSSKAYLALHPDAEGRDYHSCACAMMRRPGVQRYIAEAMLERQGKLGVTAQRIILELARIAFSDISLALDDNGRLKPLLQIPEDVRKAISSIRPGPNGVSITMHSKEKALELLGKWNVLNLFQENVNVQGNISLAQAVKELDMKRQATEIKDASHALGFDDE